MKISINQSNYNTQNRTNNAQKAVHFTAGTNDMLKLAKTADICPQQAELLKITADFLEVIKSHINPMKNKPKELSFNLGEDNKVPNFLRRTPTGSIWFEFNKALLKETHTCKGMGSCTNGLPQGLLIKRILGDYGIANPEKIELIQPKKSIKEFLVSLRTPTE